MQNPLAANLRPLHSPLLSTLIARAARDYSFELKLPFWKIRIHLSAFARACRGTGIACLFIECPFRRPRLPQFSARLRTFFPLLDNPQLIFLYLLTVRAGIV